MYILVLITAFIIIIIQFLFAKKRFKRITFLIALLYSLFVVFLIVIGIEVLLLFLPFCALVLWVFYFLSLRKEKESKYIS